MASDQDLYNLEFLSLVAKIIQEIDNHTGLNDKTLAEFVISLHDQSNKSLPAFKAKLKEVGAEFPDSFVENVDRLILSMHPKHKKKHAVKNGKGKAKEAEGALTEEEKKKRLLPGLALKDQEPTALPDDVFLKELGDLVSGKKRPAENDRSPKRQRRGRSPSPRRRSPSPRRGYGRDQGRNGGRPVIDDRPVLFKIYNGKVTGLKDFGAFVTLEGVAGRAEGMLSPNPACLFTILTRRRRNGTHISNSDRACKFRFRSSQSRSACEGESHECCGDQNQPFHERCRSSLWARPHAASSHPVRG
jgi:ATP-dependent RNA helicase DHX8/PRP22